MRLCISLFVLSVWHRSFVPSADSLVSLVCHAISQSSTRRVIPSLSQFVSQSPQSGPKMGEKPITVATGIQQTVDDTSTDRFKNGGKYMQQ